MKKILLLIFLFIQPSAKALDVYSFSTLESGPIGVAGAVTARLGNIESILYNPATYTRYSTVLWDEQPHFSIHINPAAALSYTSAFIRNEDISGFPEIDAPLSIIRGFTLFWKPFTIGTIFTEEQLFSTDGSNSSWFDIGNTPNNRRAISYLNITLSERVRVGVSAMGIIRNRSIDMFSENDKAQFESVIGSSYGVYLAPSEYVEVGVFFADLPNDFTDSRQMLSGIEDQSVNAGISITPERNTRLHIDARNVFHENDGNELEFRFGAEYNMFHHITLRAGAMPRTQDGGEYITCGIGLLDKNQLGNFPGKYSVPSFMLNYSMVYRLNGDIDEQVHLLTLMLEIG